MSTYTLYFTTVASSSAEVEADNLDDALDLAYDALPVGVCAQCSGWGGGPGIDMAGEWEFDQSSHYVDGEEVKGS